MATLLTTISQTDGSFSVSFFRSERSASNGNSRIIVHFPDFLTIDEFRQMTVEQGYALAAERARKAGFRKYTAREFGGGFIAQYDFCGCKELYQRIVNTIPSEK